MSSEPVAPRKNAAVRRGWFVFLILAVATAVEYVIAVGIDKNLPILMAIAAYKAGLILWYFMHVKRAWSAEEHD